MQVIDDRAGETLASASTNEKEGKATKTWKHHLYVDDAGMFPEDFAKSSWERRTVEAELKRKDLAGWLRNPDRQGWSFTIPRRGPF